MTDWVLIITVMWMTGMAGGPAVTSIGGFDRASCFAAAKAWRDSDNHRDAFCVQRSLGKNDASSTDK